MPIRKTIQRKDVRDVIAEVVDGLRGDSFGHESELAEIAADFVQRMVGTPWQERAEQFARDVVTFVESEEAASAFLEKGVAARRVHPPRVVSPEELAKKKQEYEQRRNRVLAGLKQLQIEMEKAVNERTVGRSGGTRLIFRGPNAEISGSCRSLERQLHCRSRSGRAVPGSAGWPGLPAELSQNRVVFGSAGKG